MIKAGEAEVVALAGCEHTLVREEGERVRINEFADLLDAVAVAYQLLRRMHIHSIVACVLQRRTCNADMHL